MDTTNTTKEKEPQMQELRQAASNAGEPGETTDRASLGWPEGQASERAEDGKGWSEGMSDEKPDDSMGWPEGLAHQRPKGSAGWAEGFLQRLTDEDAMAAGIMEAKDVIGNPVVDMDSGQIIGHVKDLFLDDDLRRVEGLYLGKKGLFSSQERLIARNNVQLIGMDTVLVQGEEVIKQRDAAPADTGWLRRDDLQGRAIETEGGTHIGSVGDVYVTRAGDIVGFALGRVDVRGPIAETSTIDRDAVRQTGQADQSMIIDFRRAEHQAG